MGESSARCERVLFVEKDEVMKMLVKIAAPDSSMEERERLLRSVTSILAKYLEQPHLLNPHLEEIVAVVMGRAKELVAEREAAVLADAGARGGGRPGEAFPFQVFICPQLQSMFCVVYQLCRVRGAKAIVRLMPHEAADLEPVIHALQAQDTEDYSTWETRYGLLLWLAMLSLVPFDIATIDSGIVGGRDAGAAGRTDLIGTIVALGMKHLGDAGPIRDAAAACLSSLLTRPDMEARHLRRFMEWAATVLERVIAECNSGKETPNKLAFLVTGVMATLAALFKQGHREKLIDMIPVIFYPVVGLAEMGSGQTLLRKMLVKLLQRVGTTFVPPRIVSWRYCRGQRSLLQNLKSDTDEIHDGSADVAAETHSENRRSAAESSQEAGVVSTEAGRESGQGPGEFHQTAEQNSDAATKGVLPDGDQETEKIDDDPEMDVPDELEDIVEALLCGLRDRDTVVRWSAAKGVGRITERLPHDLGDEVVCSVLDLFVEAEWDGSWHGGCLALAELARRGLLLPERLARAGPLVTRALQYDVRRGAGGVGAHVRDAACYVCWAFARAYSPKVLGPHLPGLCDAMLSTALFDREVNVRRAAAAAFQENVGRQGQYGDVSGVAGDESQEGGGVAHGIDIITIADYFSLGNRQQAYLDISETVAKFDRYRHHLIDSLRLDKLRHWDPELRRLSALALGRMAPLEPEYVADTVLKAALADTLSPDLLRRHGACLAASEIALALGKIAYLLPTEIMKGLIGMVPALEKARLYRGKGGELMRQAACRVVECLALTKADVNVKTQIRLLDSIDETLRHPNETVQLCATAALKAVLKNWFPVVGAKGPSDRLRSRTIGKYVKGVRTEENAAIARGCALALGVLPRKIAGASRESLEDVLEALKDAACGRHGPRRRKRRLPTPPANSTPASPTLRQDPSSKPCPPADSETARGAQENAEGGGVDDVGEFVRTPEAGNSGPGGEPDVETRRNATRALVGLCEEVGVGGGDTVGVASGVENGCSGGDGGDGAAGEDQQQNAWPSGPGATPPGGNRNTGDAVSDPPGADDGLIDGTPSRWHPVGLSLQDVAGVLDVLLVTAEDYSMDKRGDVGSWCRMEALIGMEKLTRIASIASTGIPMANRGRKEANEQNTGKPFILPAMKDRLALMELPPRPVPSPHPCDRVYVTPSMVERVVCAVLKQLSEKLDAVRECAGTVLQRIVDVDDPHLPFVPQMEALKHAIMMPGDSSTGLGVARLPGGAASEGNRINWASPAETFPIVVALLAVPEYHNAIVAGVVISVGGLSESVVKRSSTALLRWVRACKSAGGLKAVTGLGMRLVGMFGEANGDARVVVPLLKTLELLLSNDCFDFLSAEANPFAGNLLAAVAAEMKGCRDVKKICLGASVFVCMLDYSDPARSRALRYSVLFLGHRFPNVRKTTAEALYLKLLANEDVVDEAVYDETLDLLTSTAWDGNLEDAKATRSTLATLLNVKVPAAGVPGGKNGSGRGENEKQTPRKADEMESYESLVRSSGY